MVDNQLRRLPPGRTSRRINGSRVPIDWQSVERDYRTGKHSLSELGARHGCASSTIANRATQEGWQREAQCPAATPRVDSPSRQPE
jgi:hypothetical protein